MEQTGSLAQMIIWTMPLMGLAILAVVLVLLGANKDRFIVPATLIAVVLVAGISAGFEYRDEIAARFTPEPAPEPVVVAEPEPPPDYIPPEEFLKDDEPEEPEPDRYRTPGRKLIPITERDDDDERRGRRTVVVSPGREPSNRTRNTAPPPPEPAPEPARQPEPQPEPEPARPAPRPQPEQPIRTTSAPASGSGTLEIRIKGPVLETTKTPSSTPHILIVVDGKLAETIKPTRVSEQRLDNQPGGELLNVTYFWEGVYVAFTNLSAGPHSVMIDTSLDGYRQHKSSMTGSGQTQNDWNGFVDIKAGQTATLQFGTKTWMGGKLERLQ